MSEIARRSEFPDTRGWIRALPALAASEPVASASSFDPAPTPQETFLRWLTDAVEAGIAEPHAATLSTVDPSGMPDARTLLIKDVTDDGWWFSGDDRSPKGRQLETTPAAALTVYWRELGRQVRVRGPVLVGSPEVCARDFRERSVFARAVASTGRQSEVLAEPAEYDRLVQERLTALEHDPEFVSPHWTAWCVAAGTVEFWQADPGRRHLRHRYRRKGDRWVAEELHP
ncbi:pyridoxine/pyridoxamine 5'-phosphate oxidase [Rhodococcus sp. R1101]|uniref:pyridoxine/pyridoxamine 5'-phosphate oxidase n=1 Tax=Rhodococcus sp. R1101 TaxID=1170698 RepID=UPI0002D25991|nr:pyridoxal 5'-phosphate synthase [Rhodococcus sp. R1101]